MLFCNLTVHTNPHSFVHKQVRNPLSAAMSACSFVSSSLEDPEVLKTDKGREAAKEDLCIVDSSLHFINDLLRNMLDLSRSSCSQMRLNEAPTALLDDVLKPVRTMLYNRGPNVDVNIDCPDDLVISIDPLRLKQIILNLVSLHLITLRTLLFVSDELWVFV